ncbi:MAG: 50S ribosomal protein L4 [Flavobacteriales bacterium]|nr:50S ribosomal protein L4 [Flavobacteriales bacterium]
MKVDVYNIKGEKAGRSVDLPGEVFGVEPNEHVLYLAVKRYLANQRQGTHKAKEKGEIKASTRKIKRQKGTGTARAGSLKSPIFRGGGRVFGPRPRDYSQQMNKKVRRLARRSALSSKAAGGNIMVVEDFTLEAPKTSQYAGIVALLAQDKKSIMVTTDVDQNLHLSSRNLPKAKVSAASDVNTYDLLNANTIIIQESAVASLVENCK